MSLYTASLGTKKMENGRRLLQLERGDVSRPSGSGRKLLRCFAAGNIGVSLYSMAMLKHTCESVGVVFETEGTHAHTVRLSKEAGETESVDTLVWRWLE